MSFVCLSNNFTIKLTTFFVNDILGQVWPPLPSTIFNCKRTIIQVRGAVLSYIFTFKGKLKRGEEGRGGGEESKGKIEEGE